MSRPKRINLSGCVYHIICRANRDDVVFEDNNDKERFLEYLSDYAEQFDMRIHVYCLMDTHFHLLIESRKPNLSEFMRRLLTAYTVWFHRCEKRGGLSLVEYANLCGEENAGIRLHKRDLILVRKQTTKIYQIKKESEWKFRHIGQYFGSVKNLSNF